VPYGDAEALERALLRLARNRELASRLGAQAREDSKAHSWPALVDNTLAVFREAIAMRR
jgi:glycosyltransferase involved in cell wall biosynthesis